LHCAGPGISAKHPGREKPAVIVGAKKFSVNPGAITPGCQNKKLTGTAGKKTTGNFPGSGGSYTSSQNGGSAKTVVEPKMDLSLHPVWITRALLVLSLAAVTLMATLVAHAGAADISLIQITHSISLASVKESCCWCNEYICYCRPDCI
jgi:hypothetical protein